ncbi:MAG TPA: tetratricopeptide repeat protein, partial [Kofleriaceae bacterium]|nr:tetratricopeptide repeat protein [Kofleriaceae bacterium]
MKLTGKEGDRPMTQASIMRQTMRRVGILVALAVFLAGVGLPLRGIAEPNSATLQVSLDEATRLDKDVNNLYQNGKFQEAIPLAEQSLKLREKVLGAMHPAIAESLNDLGMLYWAQGAYARAEQLY